MLRSSFHYDLPDELIARYPSSDRSSSRMLVLPSSGDMTHSVFSQCLDYFKPGDLLVFNNTRVIPARLFGRKSTGGVIEILIERLLEDNQVLAQIRSSKSPKPESVLYLEDDTEVKVLRREGSFFVLSCNVSWITLTEEQGHMPLPPYIDRSDESEDRERYQTVYAKQPGAVAAPTAGLHFDLELLNAIRKMGIDSIEVTLHVGAGTYQPVRADSVEDHQMHSEWIQIDAKSCEKIRETQEGGGRVIAVGTTAMRTLETVAQKGKGTCVPFSGDTDIFIYPGYEFLCVDALITNFHLPESSLLMLVSAFSGFQRIKAAYEAAIEQRYRFFSYGDAMFLERNPKAPVDIPQ